ncbi:MAG TPA: MBL fold metallo-hydrolase [Nocardioides sp.]|uniref:MBL fold metallo-hydrolase n=1 Tax=Nocardioides sp. TaxID=35761 RepID=UPI002E3776A0|nr:MBL fold metallo-hydrolase [Nocardioides sp.]HEX3930845.1 MBL fold metallo-hydrolase [Nocardioides sp.]
MADRTFAYIQRDGSWWINNTGFVVGDSSIVSVDACATERRTRAYRESIATVSPAPVSALVNTHHHGDHTFGNSLMNAATIVGHESCRDEMLAFGLPSNVGIWDPVDWGGLELAPPTITFTDHVTLWSADQPVEVSYVGKPAHTTNDCLVWLPEQRVLFCGDLLFNGGTPFLLMGSVRGAIEVLRDVLARVPARTIVPGHGAPCDASLIPTTIEYLEFVLSTAKAGLAAGLTPLEAARDLDLGEYADWLDSERIVGNLHRAYCDLGPSKGDVDVLAALGEMVAFNGGRPLTCYA